jgi:hypothetical protein
MLALRQAAADAESLSETGVIGAAQPPGWTLGTRMGPRLEVDSALGGYQRLLHVLGVHLRMLHRLRDPLADDTDPRPLMDRAGLARAAGLADRLTRMDPDRTSSEGVWGRAADRFGIAHDLLATHVGRQHTVHTRAALALRDPVVNHAATARILAALGDPLAVGARVARALTRTPNRTPPGAGTRRDVVWLSGALGPLARLHRACTPPTLSAPAGGSGVLAGVDALTVATPRVARTGTPATVTDPVHALHLMQLLTFRQAHGREPASAASLHDLTRLAARALTVTARTLPVPAGPLGRVHRAAAVDRLGTAHQSWAAAGAALAAPVRTLTRAPALYRDTLTVLDRALGSPAAAVSAGGAGGAGGAGPESEPALHDVIEMDVATSRDLAVRVVTALPGLAADATTTWGRLTATGTVVTPVRDAGRHHAEWRQVPDRQAWLVRGTLEAAQVCSARAVTAVTTVLNAHAAAGDTDLGVAAEMGATGPAAPNPSPGGPVAPGPVTAADRAIKPDRPAAASVAGRPPSRRPGWPPPGKTPGATPGAPSGPPTGPTPAGPSRPGRPPARPRPHPRFRAEVPADVAAGVVPGGGRGQDGVRR